MSSEPSREVGKRTNFCQRGDCFVLFGLQFEASYYDIGSGRNFKKTEGKARTRPEIDQGGFDFIHWFNKNDHEKPLFFS